MNSKDRIDLILLMNNRWTLSLNKIVIAKVIYFSSLFLFLFLYFILIYVYSRGNHKQINETMLHLLLSTYFR